MSPRLLPSIKSSAQSHSFRLSGDNSGDVAIGGLRTEEIDSIVRTVPGGAANVQDIYPLAPLQEGILFHHLMGGEGDPYMSGQPICFANRAKLDSFSAALQAVIERHDILRTAVLWEGLPEPVQVVWRRAPLQVEEVQLDAMAGDAAGSCTTVSILADQYMDVRHAPLLRIYLAQEPGVREMDAAPAAPPFSG